jgi:hypothetical protein|tara:strand:- start:8 stop:700 length:693 start_codon:yes stop_codon:yes gene_type:complete
MSKRGSVLVIGNKPFLNLSVSVLIDSFDKNVRCNMGIPNGKNGTKKDEIAVCSHIQDYFVKQKLPWDHIKKIYIEDDASFKEDHLLYFYENFKPSDYSFIWDIPPVKDRYNDILNCIDCPHKFEKQPRLGYAILLEKITQGYHPFVFGFSLIDEKRFSYYTNDYAADRDFNRETCHDRISEIKILNWLHEKNIVDATFCLLEDKQDLSFIDNSNKRHQQSLDILESVYFK